ncbi:MAG: sensor histidine kinase, partial [Thiobacillaceae bacterium]
ATNDELERLMRFHVAGQTAAAIAHELNQPLNAVASFNETALRLLRADTLQMDKLHKALESSAQQAQRAGRVLRELLAFIGKDQAPTEPVDLNDTVNKVLARMEAEGQERFHVKLELEPNLPPVRANRLQVEKVLTNLVENGIEAMRDGGINPHAITVTISTFGDGSMARATVRDNGPGISAQIVGRIFDPFFTTKARGLGMGLPLSRAIIEAHGGQLWVESDTGSGARFHFTLPFAT